MSFNDAKFRDRYIDEAVQELGLNDDDLDFFGRPNLRFSVDKSLNKLSGDRPHRVVQEAEGNGEKHVLLPSDILHRHTAFNIEYPVRQIPPRFVDDTEWEVIEEGNSYDITKPAASATQVTISTPANATFFRDGDIVEIRTVRDDQVLTEFNWVETDGNTTTGIVVLKNAIANDHNASPYTGIQTILRQGRHLFFYVTAPAAGQFFRIHYEIQWTLEAVTNDVGLKAPFKHLMAYFVALYVKSFFAKMGNSTFAGDNTNYTGKSTEWKDTAEVHLDLYNRNIGVGLDKPKSAASETVHLNVRPAWGSFLTHK